MHDQQAVLCLNDQGGSVMSVEQDGNAAESGMKQTNYICYENHAQDSRIKDLDGVCSQISAKAGTGGGNLPLVQERIGYYPSQYAAFQEAESVMVTAHISKGVSNEIPLVQECRAVAFEPDVAKRDGGDSRFADEICSTLRSNMGDDQTAVAIAENIIGRQVQNGGNGVGAQEELAYTQNATGVMGVCTSTVRRLLPIECERLMGFPDNWTRIPWKGKPEDECPDSPRYKACGNSMCVNVMQWIGEQIERVDNL
jgi:hypothetical protein